MSFLISFGGSPRSFAQIDSGGILLQSSGEDNSKDGIDSGRYQVRPEEAPLPSTKPAKLKKRGKSRQISSESSAIMELPAKPTEASRTTEAPPNTPPPSYVDQVKGLVLGNNQPIAIYRDQIHPDDVRLNRIEINVQPGLVYYNSQSSYSYRNYLSYSPFLSLGAEIWWTPFIGLYGQYGTSFGADIIDNGTAGSRAPVTHEIIEGGVDFRKFFGFSRRSNSITFGLNYFEYKLGLPSDNSFRSRTKSNGVGIHFQARFPVAPSYSWIVGAKMEPRIAHSEYGTTLGLQSGSSPESSRFTLSVGGEFKLSREHQLVWNLSTALEKNQFTGQANLVDPETGAAPQGVSVAQTLSLFTLGYRWGH